LSSKADSSNDRLSWMVAHHWGFFSRPHAFQYAAIAECAGSWLFGDESGLPGLLLEAIVIPWSGKVAYQDAGWWQVQVFHGFWSCSRSMEDYVGEDGGQKPRSKQQAAKLLPPHKTLSFGPHLSDPCYLVGS